MKTPANLATAILAITSFSVVSHATILVDTSPGTGAPPDTLGGYTMTPFAPDGSPVGFLTSVTDVAPPAGALVTGNLTFTTSLAHHKIGSDWDTWSHSYKEDVYSTDQNDLMMLMPQDTRAFYFYVEPNRKYTFQFKADSSATVTLLDIDGNSGARYVGFYTDSPSTEALKWVYVLQTTGESDGFAVGEFGINGTVVPEPSTCLAGLLLLGLFGFEGWRTQRSQKRASN